MATNTASQPDELTEKIKADRAFQNRVAVPMVLTSGIIIDYLCRTALSDQLFDNFGIVKVDENYDPIAKKAVVYPNNIEPTRATVQQVTGSESGFVGKDKILALKVNPDYTLSKGYHKIPRMLSGKSVLYYAIINGLYIGEHVRFPSKADQAKIEALMTSTGMKKADKGDTIKIIMKASFPRLARAQAPNGVSLPIDPSKIDSLPDGWTITDQGAYTKDQFNFETKGW